MGREAIDKCCNSGFVPGRAGIAQLEADIAYFDARLALLGKPETPCQAAQLKVYRVLQGRLIENLIRLKVRIMTEGDAFPVGEG